MEPYAWSSNWCWHSNYSSQKIKSKMVKKWVKNSFFELFVENWPSRSSRFKQANQSFYLLYEMSETRMARSHETCLFWLGDQSVLVSNGLGMELSPWSRTKEEIVCKSWNNIILHSSNNWNTCIWFKCVFATED